MIASSREQSVLGTRSSGGDELLDEGLRAGMQYGPLASHECDLAGKPRHVNRMGADLRLGFDLHGARRKDGDSQPRLHESNGGRDVVDLVSGQCRNAKRGEHLVHSVAHAAAGTHENERAIGQQCRAAGRLVRRRSRLGIDDMELVAEQLGPFEPGMQFLAHGDPEIDFTRAHQRYDVAVDDVANDEVHSRALLLEVPDHVREQRRRAGRQARKPDQATLGPRDRIAGIGDCRLELANDPAEDGQEVIAECGQLDGAGVPIEKSQAQLVLKLADPVGQGRLRQVQNFRGPREATCRGDGDKGTDLAKRDMHG